MLLQKKVLPLLLLSLPWTPLLGQMKVFTAPPSADTINNPLKGNTSGAIEGKKLYISYCTPCHGVKGKGDGVASAGLNKTPADHTTSSFQKQTDGAIYWKLSEGNTPMPGYKKVLSETQRWQLIDFIRTLAKSSK